MKWIGPDYRDWDMNDEPIEEYYEMAGDPSQCAKWIYGDQPSTDGLIATEDDWLDTLIWISGL